MVGQLYLETEENDNCGYIPMLAYETRADAVPVKRVRLFDSEHPHGIYQITGWRSERGGTPCPALYVPVSDSGQDQVHLIYGGDWGIRLKPLESPEEWNITSPDQWGESYLMLTDKNDVLLSE